MRTSDFRLAFVVCLGLPLLWLAWAIIQGVCR